MEKIDDNTLSVEIGQSAEKKVVYFERGYLEKQRQDIISQRDEQLAQREKELAEVDAYLAMCDALGIVASARSDDQIGV